MSVWDDIDKLKRAHEAEVEQLRGKVREFFEVESHLSCNDYGVFKLTWRKNNQSFALTGPSLARVLEQLRAMAPKKPLELRGGG